MGLSKKQLIMDKLFIKNLRAMSKDKLFDLMYLNKEFIFKKDSLYELIWVLIPEIDSQDFYDNLLNEQGWIFSAFLP